MGIGDATNNIYHIPHFMGGKFEAREGKGLPKITAEKNRDHNPALYSADSIISTLLLLVQANSPSTEWSLMWVQTNQFLPQPECTGGITFQTHPTCFQSKENKPTPQEFLQPQKSTPALPSPLLGSPKNQVAPATFKGGNAFW